MVEKGIRLEHEDEGKKDTGRYEEKVLTEAII